MMRLAQFVLLGMLLAGSLSHAQAQPAPNSQPPSVSNAPTGKIIDYTLPPDKLQKSHALYIQTTRLQVIDTIYGFLVLLGLLYAGTVAKFRSLAESVTQRKWLQSFIVIPLFVIAVAVLTIPSDVYHQHLSLQYGLSVQSWGSWWGDWIKNLLITIVIGTILLSLLYAMIRRSPKRWWFYGWLISIPIVVFLIFITPIVLEPLFFKFTPLEQTNPELVTQIERVVKRGGLEIPPERMYLMNAGTKYTGDNAYVTGFGATKRVVVWDTTAKHMTTEQVMFVFGHEMGHYVLGHIPKLIIFLLVVLLIFLYLAYACSDWVLKRWGVKWHIREFSDLAAVPLLVLLISFFAFVFTPVNNGFSRYVEHQADTYGLEVTHGLMPDQKVVAQQAFQILGENWLEYPDAGDFYEWWSQNHPLVKKRMRYAQEYDPWGQGKDPEFVKRPHSGAN
jgi:Zn-dependent protease with chaperone function